MPFAVFIVAGHAGNANVFGVMTFINSGQVEVFEPW
jgi:hypothetical protein